MIDIIRFFTKEQIEITYNRFCNTWNCQTIINQIKKRKDSKKIIIYLVPRVFHKNPKNCLPLFREMCEEPLLGKYVLLLFKNNLVKPEKINKKQMIQILQNFAWGEQFIIHNIEDILINNPIEKIDSIIEILSSHDQYIKFLICFLKIKSEDSKVYFLAKSSLKYKKNVDELLDEIISVNDPKQTAINGFDKEEFINSIYSLEEVLNYYLKKGNFEKVIKIAEAIFLKQESNHVLTLLYPYIFRKDIETLLFSNLETILKYSLDGKVQLLKYIKLRKVKLSPEYQMIYQFIHCKDVDLVTERNLEGLLNSGYIKEVYSLYKKYLQISKRKEVRYISHGFYSCVFQIGDYVMKIGKERAVSNCNYQFYRFLKSYEKLVKIDQNGCPLLFIEIQPYLEIDRKEITKEMITDFFKDLDKAGLIILDPNTNKYSSINFGLLEDYHNANIPKGFDIESLPESFKKHPLVLVDVDYIFSKEELENEKQKIRHFS